MTGHFFLDWAILSVSLFNTILMLWLGLAVWLNAERRAWGVWLISGSLLLGGVFFISHTAILGFDFTSAGLGPNLNFWWRAAWGPVAALPFAWYVVILWYAGFWENRRAALFQRQRWPFVFTVMLVIALAGLLLFANPLPSLWPLVVFDLAATPNVVGVPLLILVYPVYAVLCIALSLDALRRPGPSARMMGDLARRRAQPWLAATALLLLMVSFLVGAAMMWIVLNVEARQRSLFDFYDTVVTTIGWFDFIIASLIGLVVILMGQAVVAYEVFTGETLPRRGLLRYWRNAVTLAAGFGVTVGLALTLHLRPIYSVLLTTLVMTIFYALSSWRAFAERERYMQSLRPFVASQQLYEHLLTPSAVVSEATEATPPETDVRGPFRALCENVLGARRAYLAALGPLAPLVGPPLAYPESLAPPLPALTPLAAHFDSPRTIIEAIDAGRYAEAHWAVPLWSERGLIGVLLLGEKSDGGLYSQEEIEIARASGERLIDTQASAEMARRLMALQRQRLAESQVVDRQTRRALHDDVLPRLHTAMLALNQSADFESPVKTSEVLSLLGDAHRQISELLRAMPSARAPEVARLGLVGALRQTVDDDLGHAFDAVTWRIEPDAETQAHTLPALNAEVLFYAAREAIRNAARYGRADAVHPLRLTIAAEWRDGLTLIIEDDGAGVDAAASQGSGQGLALHSTLLAVVGGTLAVESELGRYTRVSLHLPPAPISDARV
jgi:signal transduction histidine kinase